MKWHLIIIRRAPVSILWFLFLLVLILHSIYCLNDYDLNFLNDFLIISILLVLIVYQRNYLLINREFLILGYSLFVLCPAFVLLTDLELFQFIFFISLLLVFIVRVSSNFMLILNIKESSASGSLLKFGLRHPLYQ